MEFTIDIRSPLSIHRGSHRGTTSQSGTGTNQSTQRQTARREPTFTEGDQRHQNAQGAVQPPAVPARHDVDTLPDSTGQETHQRQPVSSQSETAPAQTPVSLFGSNGKGRAAHAHTTQPQRKTLGLSKKQIIFLGVALLLAIQIFGALIWQQNYANQLAKTYLDYQFNPFVLMAVSIGGLYTSLSIIFEKYLYPVLLVLIVGAAIYWNGGI